MLRAARAAALLAAARAEGGAAASTSGSSSSISASSSSGSERRGGMLFFFARSLASTPAPAPAAAAPVVDGIECTVNGKTVTIPKGANVMAACDAAGVDIPRYEERVVVCVEGEQRRCPSGLLPDWRTEKSKMASFGFFLCIAAALALSFNASLLAHGHACSRFLSERIETRARECLEQGGNAA